MSIASLMAMTISDALIIYFAFGAPFAVYRYLQDRKLRSPQILLHLIINFIFWLPLAVRMGVVALSKISRSRSDHKTSYNFDAVKDEKVHKMEDLMKKEFKATQASGSIKDFREVLERYIGLTLSAAENVGRKHELFSISEHPNRGLADTCLNRRNRIQLGNHQTRARVDFLKAIGDVELSRGKSVDMRMYAVDLAEILGDAVASAELLSGKKRQFGNKGNVNNAENNIWIPSEQERSNLEHSRTI